MVQQNKMPNLRDFRDLEHYIRSNTSLPDWDMKLLEEAIQQGQNNESWFYSVTMPKLIKLANVGEMNVRNLLEKFETSTTVQLTRLEVAIILANAFLCKLPYTSEDTNINFNKLYSSHTNRRPSKLEKLKCILCYVDAIVAPATLHQKEIIEYRKHQVNFNVKTPLEKGDKLLNKFSIVPKVSLMEARGVPQVSFANKCFGGGVLANGCLQEEILVITCLEVLLAKLFPQEMQDDEAIIVSGARQYVKCKGYAATFECVGPQTPPQAHPQAHPQADGQIGPIIAMDAYDFSLISPEQQKEPNYILRELHKAYAGFGGAKLVDGRHKAIATGNWGGGNYQGDPVLKMKIQWLAASLFDRDLLYYTYNNHPLKNDLEEVERQWRNKKISDLYLDLIPGLKLDDALRNQHGSNSIAFPAEHQPAELQNPVAHTVQGGRNARWVPMQDMTPHTLPVLTPSSTAADEIKTSPLTATQGKATLPLMAKNQLYSPPADLNEQSRGTDTNKLNSEKSEKTEENCILKLISYLSCCRKSP